jgi:hypothetical protein
VRCQVRQEPLQRLQAWVAALAAVGVALDVVLRWMHKQQEEGAAPGVQGLLGLLCAKPQLHILQMCCWGLLQLLLPQISLVSAASLPG